MSENQHTHFCIDENISYIKILFDMIYKKFCNDEIDCNDKEHTFLRKIDVMCSEFAENNKEYKKLFS